MGNTNKTLYVIIGLAVSMILLGVLLPIGLYDLTAYTGAYNSSQVVNGTTTYNAGVNSTVGTLVATILPVMIVIGIVLAMVALMKARNGGGGEI